jgi:hypothetical protein
MDSNTFQLADFGSLAAVLISFVAELVSLSALPSEVAIQWAANGSPNTVLPALPGVFLIPLIALLTFAYLRGGALLSRRDAKTGASTGLPVAAGVAYLQIALVALNLGVTVSPLVAVAPGVLVLLAAPYVGRVGSQSSV